MKYLYAARDLKPNDKFTHINDDKVWICVSNSLDYCLVTIQSEENGEIDFIEYQSYINSDREPNVMLFGVPEIEENELSRIKNAQSGVIHWAINGNPLCNARFMQDSVISDTLDVNCDRCLAVKRRGNAKQITDKLLRDVKLVP